MISIKQTLGLNRRDKFCWKSNITKKIRRNGKKTPSNFFFCHYIFTLKKWWPWKNKVVLSCFIKKLKCFFIFTFLAHHTITLTGFIIKLSDKSGVDGFSKTSVWKIRTTYFLLNGNNNQGYLYMRLTSGLILTNIWSNNFIQRYLQTHRTFTICSFYK